MMQRIAFTSLTLVCAACGGAPEGGAPSRSTEQAIVNGTQSVAADDAVVMLVLDEGGLCTGTLVAPNLVITARHCVADIDESSQCGTFGADLDPSSIGVALGVHADPDNPDIVANGSKLFHEDGIDGCTTDIAFILLDAAIPNAKVAAVRTTPAVVGEAARTLGYGENGKRGHHLTDGRFERTGLTIDAVGPDSYDYDSQDEGMIPVDLTSGLLLTGESTCFGDSGGPLFDHDGAVIAVTSSGIDELCVDRPSLYSTTATHVALVQKAFDAAGVATPDAGAPDSGVSSSSSSSSSSSGSGDDDGSDDDTETSSSSGSAAHDTNTTTEESGCGVASRTGLGGSGVLWALAGLVAIRRRKQS